MYVLTVDSPTSADPIDIQYDLSREYILRGPDYSYNLDTSILCTNRQIRNEALDLFEGELTFISLIHDNFDRYPCCRASAELRGYGVAVVAEGNQARAFPMIGMSIDFDAGNRPPIREDGSLAEREVSVFALEDLPFACVYLQRKMPVYTYFSSKAKLRISINNRMADTPAATKDTRPAAKSKLGRCIDTLSRLRGAGLVKIDGPLSPACEIDTESAMCRYRLTATEVMNMVEAHYDSGDKAWMKDDLESAIAEYKEALCVIRSRKFYEEYYVTMIGGRFDGYLLGFARVEAKVRLRTLIAECFLQSKQYPLARKYVERVYYPLHTYNNRFRRQKFPLRLPDNSNPMVYARLLLVAAQISLAYNNKREALRELGEAAKHDPANQDIQTLLEQCSVSLEERNRRRKVTREQQRASAERKFRAALEVTSSRIIKGDKAFRNANFTLAQEKYEAAYSKIQPLSYSVGANNCYTLNHMSKDLNMDVLAKLITTCLQLSDYDAVHFWTSTLNIHVPRFLREYRHDKKRVLYAVDAFYTAYYCKAVVFQKLGQPIEAIQNFERALVCDPGCHATYYQLAALKESQECEETKSFTGNTTIDYTLHPFAETYGFFFSPDVAW